MIECRDLALNHLLAVGHGTPTARGSHLRNHSHPFAHIGVRDHHLSTKAYYKQI